MNELYKYDDASWHYGGQYPDDLNQEAASVHAAMFFIWMFTHNLVSDDMIDFISADDVEERKLSPNEIYLQVSDEKLVSDMFNDEGNKFAKEYFDFEEGTYMYDYDRTFPNVPTSYHVPPTWASFDKIAPVIKKAYESWKAQTK